MAHSCLLMVGPVSFPAFWAACCGLMVTVAHTQTALPHWCRSWRVMASKDELQARWLHRMLGFPHGVDPTPPSFGAQLKGSSPCLASDSQAVRGKD